MKRLILLAAFCSLVLLISDSPVNAQGPGGGPGQGGGPGGQQTPPLLRVFDADGDGEISSKEIDAAAAALRKLDRNSDGKVTFEEFRPNAGQGQGPGRGLSLIHISEPTRPY